MDSYNLTNGQHMSQNRYLLTDVVKKEWGFDRVVMSDWFGTQSTAASINAGLDLEMPGPTIWRGEQLLQAIEKLKAHGIETAGFGGKPTREPWVIGWMPSAQIYFRDPDGHSLDCSLSYHCLQAPRSR